MNLDAILKCEKKKSPFLVTSVASVIVTQKKTGKKVEVPIFDDRVYELCEKYNYNFPDITAQKMNLKIKAAREAMKKQVLAGASGKAERTSRNL